jgi:hypothetical protein
MQLTLLRMWRTISNWHDINVDTWQGNTATLISLSLCHGRMGVWLPHNIESAGIMGIQTELLARLTD